MYTGQNEHEPHEKRAKRSSNMHKTCQRTPTGKTDINGHGTGSPDKERMPTDTNGLNPFDVRSPGVTDT